MSERDQTKEFGELSKDQLQVIARRKAVEDALVELAGPIGKTMACEESPECTRTGSLPDPNNRGLLKNIITLEEVHEGNETRFRHDLDVINRRLKRRDFALQIDGVDSTKTKIILKSDTRNDRFQVIREDGFLTIAPLEHTVRSQKFEALDETPSPDDVIQGRLGDCYFLATAASVANTDPQTLRNMIKTNADGSYTVKFLGNENVITVDRPNEAELSWLSEGPLKWINILEKAHRKLTEKSLFDPGGQQNKALKLLTGKDSASIQITSDIKDFGTDITENRVDLILRMAMANAHPVVAGSRIKEETAEDSITGGHSYSVLNYDAERKIVTVRNPTGDNGEKFPRLRRGVYEIPLRAFVKNFNQISTIKDGFPVTPEKQ